MPQSEPRQQAAAYLEALHGHHDPNEPVSLFAAANGDTQVRWSTTGTPEATLDHISRLHGTHNIWLGIATRTEALGSRRGGVEHCHTVSALWLDIDYGTVGHKPAEGQQLCADLDEALELVRRFPLPPSMIVHTGGGIQPYWLLQEPATADEYRAIVDSWETTWRQIAHPIHVDSVFNIDRVLRIPGTVNRKEGLARPVELHDHTGTRYGLDDLEQYLVEPTPTQRPAAPQATTTKGDRPGDIYNQRHSAVDVLTRAGWTHMLTLPNGDQRWVRPGKNPKDGTSATIYADNGCIHVFTDATHLPSNTQMQPFTFYVHNEHGGDYSAAGRYLLDRHGDTYRPTTMSTPVVSGIPLDSPSGELAPKERPVTPIVTHHTPPAFPIDVLPEWMTDMIHEVAQTRHAPIDLSIVGALGTLSALLNTGKVSLQADQTWIEGLNLYLVGVAESGSGKSPSLEPFKKPLVELEEQWDADTKDDRSEQIVALRLAEAEKSTLEKMFTARPGGPPVPKGEERQEIIGQLVELEGVIEDLKRGALKPPQVIVDDVTVEAFVQVLDDNHGRISVLSDEPTMFENLGRYSEKASAGGTVLSPYLMAFSGQDIRVNRKTAGNSLIKSARATMAIMAQDGITRQIIGDAKLDDRGFSQRFMIHTPQPIVGTRDYKAKHESDPRVVEHYEQTVKQIGGWCIPPAAVQLSLSPEAFDAYTSWMDGHESDMLPRGSLRHIAKPMAKIRQSVLRLSAILHCAHHPDNPPIVVDVDMVNMACTVGEYWMSHLLCMLAEEWQNPTDIEAATRILAKYVDSETFTMQDVLRWGGVQRLYDSRKLEAIVPAVSLLIEHGWAASNVDDWDEPKRGRTDPANLWITEKGRESFPEGLEAEEPAELRVHHAERFGRVQRVQNPKSQKSDYTHSHYISDDVVEMDSPETARVARGQMSEPQEAPPVDNNVDTSAPEDPPVTQLGRRSKLFG